MPRDQAQRAAMLKPFDRVFQATTFKGARESLGQALQLTEPAPTVLTARVLSDAKFAERLAAVRFFPNWRQRLIDDPMNAAFDPGAGVGTGKPADASGIDDLTLPSTVDLVRKSSAALLRWGATGFKTAEPWVVENRTAACLACPKLVEAPDRLTYRIGQSLTGADNRVCSACGCLMTKKVTMPDERCPVASDDDPRRTRWGDYIVDAADHH